MKNPDFTILGGGWSGLLCGYELAKKMPRANIVILDSSKPEELGGLLRSEVIDGFTFDIGGPHILFSKNKKILERIVEFLGVNVTQIERNAYVYYRDRYVPYPFENGIYVLDPESRARFGTDIIEAMLRNARNPDWLPITFKDWIYGFFGNAMGSEYLEPYNWKIWKTNPENMDASWVFSPGRLPFPVLKDMVDSIAGIKSVGYREQQFFYYPKHGGINALYDSLLTKIRDLKVEFVPEYKVKIVEKDGGEWLINGNLRTKRIVNTLPLTTLPTILEMPDNISKLTKKLEFTTDVVVGIALNKPGPTVHVLYVPSAEINFHRLTWMSNLAGSPSSDSSNLIAETTVPGDTIPDVGKILEDTIEGLIKIHVINSRKEVLFARAWVNRFGYPVYNREHSEVRAKIFDYLDHIGIYSVGRWGSWHYWNTDRVYEAVLETVSKIDA